MKRFALSSALLFCLLATACKKDKQKATANISAEINMKSWATAQVNTGFKPLETKDTLFIYAHNGEENLVIAVKQKGAGTYSANEFKAYYYITVGLDAVTNRYVSATDAGNQLTIIEYNEATQTIKGNFSFVLNRAYPGGTGTPATVKFTNGNINTKLTAVYADPFK